MEADAPGARFERGKQKLGLVAGPILAVIVGLLSESSRSPELIGIMTLCVTWWLTEALPPAAVAFAAAIGAVLTGIATPDVAFKAFGTPLLFLFVGAFFIAEAMQVHGLGERIGALVARHARSRLSFLMVLAGGSFFISMWMSNTAATVILLPIALSAASDDKHDRFGTALALVVPWGASIGGLGTPVGSPPNGLGITELSQRGLELGFFKWMSIGVPMGLLMMFGLVGILAVTYGVRPRQSLPSRPIAAARPWSVGEKSVIGAFCFAILGWLVPAILIIVAPDAPFTVWLDKHLTEEVVALTAGCALFVLPGGTSRPALTWSEATRIEWGVILLFGGGILLGTLAKTTGVAEQWGLALVDATGASSTWSITALVTATSIILSEATSNVATASMLAPLAGALASAAGVSAIPPVLGVTMGASFGFMLPISNGPNAIAYATGRITVGQMVKTGILFDVIGFVLIVVTLRIMCPLLGWA
jgi:solute carrier family 13 (sodium-dependent dicarboxylate transporter), member 2/3/5